MRPTSDLFPYQHKAIEFQCSHPASALWMDMGLGNTVVTLTSVAYFLGTAHEGGAHCRAIRVCRLVWRQEAFKWPHTRHLRSA